MPPSAKPVIKVYLIDLPAELRDDDLAAQVVGEALHRQRTDLRVQCEVYRSDPTQGLWSTH